MKVCLITLGCKVNQAETQKWEKYLHESGYELTNIKEEADFWIINTCAVTQKAEAQSRQIINKAKKLNKKTIVTGCFVELYRKNFLGDNIKFILNSEKESLIRYFSPIFKNNNLNLSRHRAIVKIQDGCNHFCSYCIVPFLRGNPKSVPVNKVLEEIRDYERIGIKEIVLSGINIGLYGIDSEENITLNSLILEILERTSIPKIRLSSIEINHINDEFLDVIKDNRICKHLHIPLQHGSNRILTLMNRKYTIEQYIDVLQKIFKLYPEISIGTDVIIGFPTETKEDFNKTLQLIEEIGFSYLHVFTYSKRPYTKASEFREDLSSKEKKDRKEVLLKISRMKRANYIKKFINKNVEAIIENKKNNLFSATSDNYIKCLVNGKNLIKGSLVKIKIKESNNEYAIGEVIN